MGNRLLDYLTKKVGPGHPNDPLWMDLAKTYGLMDEETEANKSYDEEYKKSIHPSAPPISNEATMRAPTWGEKYTGGLQSLFGEVAKQPIAKISDLTGETAFQQMADSFSQPPPEVLGQAPLVSGLPFSAYIKTFPTKAGLTHGTSTNWDVIDRNKFDKKDIMGDKFHGAEDPEYSGSYALGETKHHSIDKTGAHTRPIIPEAKNVLDSVSPNADDISQVLGFVDPAQRKRLISLFKDYRSGRQSFFDQRHYPTGVSDSPATRAVAEKLKLSPQGMLDSPFDAIRYNDMAKKSWAIPVEKTRIKSGISGQYLSEELPKEVKVVRDPNPMREPDELSQTQLTPHRKTWEQERESYTKQSVFDAPKVLKKGTPEYNEKWGLPDELKVPKALKTFLGHDVKIGDTFDVKPKGAKDPWSITVKNQTDVDELHFMLEEGGNAKYKGSSLEAKTPEEWEAFDKAQAETQAKAQSTLNKYAKEQENYNYQGSAQHKVDLAENKHPIVPAKTPTDKLHPGEHSKNSLYDDEGSLVPLKVSKKLKAKGIEPEFGDNYSITHKDGTIIPLYIESQNDLANLEFELSKGGKAKKTGNHYVFDDEGLEFDEDKFDPAYDSGKNLHWTPEGESKSLKEHLSWKTPEEKEASLIEKIYKQHGVDDASLSKLEPKYEGWSSASSHPNYAKDKAALEAKKAAQKGPIQDAYSDAKKLTTDEAYEKYKDKLEDASQYGFDSPEYTAVEKEFVEATGEKYKTYEDMDAIKAQEDKSIMDMSPEEYQEHLKKTNWTPDATQQSALDDWNSASGKMAQEDALAANQAAEAKWAAENPELAKKPIQAAYRPRNGKYVADKPVIDFKDGTNAIVPEELMSLGIHPKAGESYMVKDTYRDEIRKYTINNEQDMLNLNQEIQEGYNQVEKLKEWK